MKRENMSKWGPASDVVATKNGTFGGQGMPRFRRYRSVQWFDEALDGNSCRVTAAVTGARISLGPKGPG